MRRSLAVLVFLVLPVLPAGVGVATEPAPELQVSAMLANVGNVNPSCGAFDVWKLCHTATEERIASRLQAYAPDLVVLIEVLPSWICDEVPGASANPFGVCQSSAGDTRSQVERLLGPGYEITCGRYGWDCLAIRAEAGSIQAPLVSLDVPSGCDDGFVVGYADVTLHGGEFRVLLGHPDSMSASCRTAALQALFDHATARSLLIGDMNLDPRGQTDASAVLWNQHVGEGKTFAYHSDPEVLTHAPSDISALDPTGTLTPDFWNCVAPFGCAALDHVASNFADGGCAVLGETGGTERLDGGGGADHRALLCDLTL